MNSEQEKIVTSLSQFSFGSPFIFEPDEYSKGNAKREPADLVWACNNCIILFYMTEKKFKEGPSSETITNRRLGLINHNFIQAEGWFKEWKKGRNIKGKNKFQDFNIGYNDYKYCVVLSIIDFGNEEGIYHEEYEKKLNVSLFATLDQKSFSRAVSIGFTIVDFVNVIIILKGEKNLVSVPNLIKSYWNYSLKKAKFPIEIDVKDESEIVKKVDIYFNKFRSFETGKMIGVPVYDDISILNDIELYEFFLLKKFLFETLREIGNDFTTYTIRGVKLKKYNVIISVSHFMNFYLIGEKVAKTMSEFITESGGFSMIYELKEDLPFIAYIPRTNISYLEKILNDKIKN